MKCCIRPIRGINIRQMVGDAHPTWLQVNLITSYHKVFGKKTGDPLACSLPVTSVIHGL
jgi:hypothetical protein